MPAPDQARSLRHYAYLDSIRALASLWIVIHHCWYEVQGKLTGLSAKVLSIFSQGEIAVELFISLSGFCLMLPVIRDGGKLRGGMLAFLKRRAWRILPPYYFAILISLALIWLLIGKLTGTHWDNALPPTLHSVITHMLLINDCFAADYGTINHVFWSIAVEWRIYFFFPALVWTWARFGPIAATVLGILVAMLLSRSIYHFANNTIHFEYLGIFAEGMLGAAIAFSDAPLCLRLRRWPWGWIALALAGAIFAPLHLPLLETRVLYFIVGLCLMAFLVFASDPRVWINKVLSLRPLAFLGLFAYSIYLIHAPLVQVLWQYPFAFLQDRPVLMFCALIFPGVPFILAICYLFFLVCERPFLLGRRRSIEEIAGPPLNSQRLNPAET